MPKEKDTHAAEILGWPAKLVNQIVKGAEQRDWVQERITKGGPPHKQLQHTLVLNRLEHLAALLKKTNGFALKPIKGLDIVAEGDENALPLTLPMKCIDDVTDRDDLMVKMTRGPQHEILYTTLLLQIIENMIAGLEDVKKAPDQ